MNTFKKFLVLGSALVNINLLNVVSADETSTMQRSCIFRGGYGISKHDTMFDHLVTIENPNFDPKKEGSKIAELRLGIQEQRRPEDYQPKTITMDYNAQKNSAGVIKQTEAGHLHVFDKLVFKDKTTAYASQYNPEHVDTDESDGSTSIHDYDRTAKTVGFDVHGDKDQNGGVVIFEAGSKITLTPSETYPKKNNNQEQNNNNGNNNDPQQPQGQDVNPPYNPHGPNVRPPQHNPMCKCCDCCCCTKHHHPGGGQPHGPHGGDPHVPGGDVHGGGDDQPDDGNNGNDKYPAIYLCNANSTIDISQLLPEIDPDNPLKTTETKVHIVGTHDKDGNRQGNVDIFNTVGDPSSHDAVPNIINQINKMGNDDVILEDTKINVPSIKMQVVEEGEDGSVNPVVDENIQHIIGTTLHDAENTGTEENPVYDTVNGREKIHGDKIQVAEVKEIDGKLVVVPTTEFMYGNLVDLLRDRHLKNYEDDNEYTYVVKDDEEETKTGIKIKPQITDFSKLDEVFSPSSSVTITNVSHGEEQDKRVTVQEFINSIQPNGIKLNVYKKISNNKYYIYNEHLNDPNYTLELDEFYNQEGHIVPFKDAVPENFYNVVASGENPIYTLINMGSLAPQPEQEGEGGEVGDNPMTVLPIYTNLKGTLPCTWMLPNDGSANQILEVNFFGNNTKYKLPITLEEKHVDLEDEAYVGKILFDENSYVKTDRTNRHMPIIWEFVGSDNDINQDNNLYASEPTTSLALLALDNKNKKEDMKVELNNPELMDKNNDSPKLSYIYTDEVFFTQNGEVPSDNKHESALTCNERSVLSLVNDRHKVNALFPIVMFKIVHVDNNHYKLPYDSRYDGTLYFRATSPFFHTATSNLNTQIQNLDNDEVIFHIALPKAEAGELSNNGQQVNCQYLDVCSIKDPSSNKNKLRFYSMIEYVYDSGYDIDPTEPPVQLDGDERTNKNTEFSTGKSHIYIPLRALPDCGVTKYYLTDTQIFNTYSKDKLLKNFRNALNDSIDKTTIIPRIYLGNNIVETSGIEANVLNNMLEAQQEPYRVYYRQTPGE